MIVLNVFTIRDWHIEVRTYLFNLFVTSLSVSKATDWFLTAPRCPLITVPGRRFSDDSQTQECHAERFPALPPSRAAPICATMDFEGQRLSELLFYWIIIVFGAIGWVKGYFAQDFWLCFQAWAVGVVISVIVRFFGLAAAAALVDIATCTVLTQCLQLCVPDWPIYNRHPVKWLESVPHRRQKEKST